MAVIRSSSDDNAIRYVHVLPVLDDVILPIIGQAKATPIERILKVTHRGAAPGAQSDIYDCHVGRMLLKA